MEMSYDRLLNAIKEEKLEINFNGKIGECVRDTSSFEECNEMLKSFGLEPMTEPVYNETKRIMKIVGEYYD